MAVSVFGNPITNSTLEHTPEFAGKKNIQKIDRARAALSIINSDGKHGSSLQHVENLKEKLGTIAGVNVVTIGSVSNATGDTVSFVTHHDWVGENALPPYLKVIENGQSGGFLHVTKSNVIIPPCKVRGSTGAVVYRGQNVFGVDCDVFVSNATGDTVNFVTHHNWVGENALPPYPAVIENGQSGGFLHVTKSSVIIPPGKVGGSAGAVVYRGQNAYTEVQERGYFGKVDWEITYKKLKESGNKSESQWNGFVSNVRIRKIGECTVFEAVLKLKE
ncbi:hypothetical protein FEM48_Zijuj07G0027500 [Ziziphus jujuba var. spinosa]|uniref:23 kDa jasmonate-induced protein-like n=1 Tax=Ziziphus jujuba var. spinosa TaxID=714518 RepID=A0A978V202_ZIZJJ|nr:hypothetical protein FEM48_Zijuj07G0027500 [Ziziphus jujuba var. spinosa]